MKPRDSTMLTKIEVRHEVRISAEITVWSRPCDFCDAQTPPPTKEQDGWAIAMAGKASSFDLEPCIARGFVEEPRANERRKCRVRPEGWVLLGDSAWACPGCAKKAEAALR